MKKTVSLKEARDLVAKIGVLLREFDAKIQLRTPLSIYESEQWDDGQIKSKLEEAQARVQDVLAQRQEIINLKFILRQAIAQANHETGINGLLTEKARLEDIRAGHKTIAGVQVDTESRAGLARRLNAMLQKTDNYHGNSQVVVNIASEAMVSEAKTAVKNLDREIKRIEDQVTALNIKTEIHFEIDETLADLLL